MEVVEGRAVVACDRSRIWQAAYFHSPSIVASGRDSSSICRRSRLALTRSDREDISRGIASGSSIREIARHLDRAASTVGREVTRHGGRPAYRAHEADDQAWQSALRPKGCLLALHRKLREVVAGKLVLESSPEQISGWLKTRYPDDPSMRVSTKPFTAACSSKRVEC